MELLVLLLVWPFLILAFGLVFIAFEDLSLGSGWLLFFISAIVVLIFLVRERNKAKDQSYIQQLKNLREILVIFSISVLLPIFIRYFFDASENSLPVIIAGLVIGFGFIIWGMFIKSHKVLMYSNIVGGTLSVLYVYSQLWDLGSGARVIAAAFGLVVAVVISSIKLKDKLT
ncbi:MAG: hypothetical protein HY395_01575 [Candidatus Doudnabacteria bacterium]|nr:hypothetical protein [Candidatus Doudnabacteria bacterium]